MNSTIVMLRYDEHISAARRYRRDYMIWTINQSLVSINEMLTK